MPFPTCVGMNRRRQMLPHACLPVPHMRGDEPLYGHLAKFGKSRSPHAWG